MNVQLSPRAGVRTKDSYYCRQTQQLPLLLLAGKKRSGAHGGRGGRRCFLLVPVSAPARAAASTKQ